MPGTVLWTRNKVTRLRTANSLPPERGWSHSDCHCWAVCSSTFAVPLTWAFVWESAKLIQANMVSWRTLTAWRGLCPVLFTIIDVAREVTQVREPAPVRWSCVAGKERGRGKVQGWQCQGVREGRSFWSQGAMTLLKLACLTVPLT